MGFFYYNWCVSCGFGVLNQFMTIQQQYFTVDFIHKEKKNIFTTKKYNIRKQILLNAVNLEVQCESMMTSFVALLILPLKSSNEKKKIG